MENRVDFYSGGEKLFPPAPLDDSGIDGGYGHNLNAVVLYAQDGFPRNFTHFNLDGYSSSTHQPSDQATGPTYPR